MTESQLCSFFFKDNRSSPNSTISTLPPPPPPLPLPPPDVASVEASIQSQFLAAAQRGEGFPFPGSAAMQHLQPLLQPPQAHTGSVKVNSTSRNGNPDLAATGKYGQTFSNVSPLYNALFVGHYVHLSIHLSVFATLFVSLSVSL